MATYTVEVQRTICTSVNVEADSAEEARAKVDAITFPLPPLPPSEWEALDGYEYVVFDEDGVEA